MLLKSDRSKVVDVAKGIGILLVVFGHTPLVLLEKGELFNVIFSFHLPLFFVLAGVFFSTRRSFGVFFVGKFRSIMGPYLLVVAGNWLFLILNDAFQAPREVFRLLWASSRTMPYGWLPVWFLPHLFVVFCVAYFCVCKFEKFAISRWGWYALIAVCLGGGKYVLVDMQNLEIGSLIAGKELRLYQIPAWPFTSNALLISMGFLIFGYLFRDRIRSYDFGGLRLVVVSLVLFAVSHIIFDYTLDLNLGVYDHVVISSLQAFSGIHLVLYASSVLVKIPIIGAWFGYLGTRSLYIMVFHSAGGHALILLLRHLNCISVGEGVIYSILLVFGGLLLSVLAYELASLLRNFSGAFGAKMNGVS